MTPHVNQIEFHPYCQPNELIEACRKSGTFVQGYCPLAKGQIITGDRLRAPIQAVADKHVGKNVAQVAIRWCLQREIGCIPKSTNVSRVKENVDVFDFELSAGDMEAIDALVDVTYVKSTWEPKELSSYRGHISRDVNRFQVEEID